MKEEIFRKIDLLYYYYIIGRNFMYYAVCVKMFSDFIFIIINYLLERIFKVNFGNN